MERDLVLDFLFEFVELFFRELFISTFHKSKPLFEEDLHW